MGADLKSNAARKAGSMGKERTKEMLFWTKEEYMKFIEAVAYKPISFYAFEILYWFGVRMGELLALTPADFDFQACTIRINKSYQRLEGKDIITDPKTVKSNRMITMPEFLSEELESYIGCLLYTSKGKGNLNRHFFIVGCKLIIIGYFLSINQKFGIFFF